MALFVLGLRMGLSALVLIVGVTVGRWRPRLNRTMGGLEGEGDCGRRGGGVYFLAEFTEAGLRVLRFREEGVEDGGQVGFVLYGVEEVDYLEDLEELWFG
jgi:hypothetical protein